MMVAGARRRHGPHLDPGAQTGTSSSARSTRTTRHGHHAPPRHRDRALPPRVLPHRGDRPAPRAVICPDCKESYDPTHDDLLELKSLGVDPDKCRGKLHHAAMRQLLQQRLLDRTASTRSSPSTRLKDQIVRTRAVRGQALGDQRFTTLRMDGAVKVARGMTTVEESCVTR